MDEITERNLITTDIITDCIVCLEPTSTRANCCRAAICKDCYLRWLSIKRQCMHCKTDQCDFEEWVERYRVDTGDLPDNFLQTHQFDNPFDFLNVISQTVHNDGALQNLTINFEAPSAILNFADDPFDLEYGFIIEQPGNEPITVTNRIPGDELTLEELQSIFDQYQNYTGSGPNFFQ